MPKILVVEDNEENRKTLSLQLQQQGFAVVTAEDGKIGIAMVEAERPHLVLLDMSMPEIDGWEATREIKAMGSAKELPIIALIASAVTEEKERALLAGCTDCHSKPIDFPKLLAQIEALLKTNVVLAW